MKTAFVLGNGESRRGDTKKEIKFGQITTLNTRKKRISGIMCVGSNLVWDGQAGQQH